MNKILLLVFFIVGFFSCSKNENKQMEYNSVIEAIQLQTDTLQLEASGEQIRYSTLFCHAQDTLMTAQSEILIGEHLVRLFENFSQK